MGELFEEGGRDEGGVDGCASGEGDAKGERDGDGDE